MYKEFHLTLLTTVNVAAKPEPPPPTIVIEVGAVVYPELVPIFIEVITPLTTFALKPELVPVPPDIDTGNVPL